MSEVANTADYLVTQKLVKRFDEAVAVDDVSLSIAKGEIFALLGSSGCGSPHCCACWRVLNRPRRAAFCWVAKTWPSLRLTTGP